MEKIALDCNLFEKKVAAKKVFGSNLLLQNKTLRVSAPTFPNPIAESGGNQWDALRASVQKIGFLSEPLIKERLYELARTYFIKNS